MLAAWTEILPLFIVRWLAKKYCERVPVMREINPRTFAVARPDILIRCEAEHENKESKNV